MEKDARAATADTVPGTARAVTTGATPNAILNVAPSTASTATLSAFYKEVRKSSAAVAPRTELSSRGPVYLAVGVIATLPSAYGYCWPMRALLVAMFILSLVEVSECQWRKRGETNPLIDLKDAGSNITTGSAPAIVFTVLLSIELILAIACAIWLPASIVFVAICVALLADWWASALSRARSRPHQFGTEEVYQEKIVPGYHRGCFVVVLYMAMLMVVLLMFSNSRPTTQAANQIVVDLPFDSALLSGGAKLFGSTSSLVSIIVPIVLASSGWLVWANDSLVFAWRWRLYLNTTGKVYTRCANPLRPLTIWLIVHDFGGFLRLADAFAIVLVACGIARVCSNLF